MSRQTKGIVAATVLSLALGMAGCGGGGGGDGGGTTTVVPTAAIPITPANAIDVASATLGATDILSDFDTGSIFGTASASGSSAAAPNKRLELADILSDQLKRLQALVPQTSTEVTAAVVLPPTTFDCLVSGTLTVSGDIADPTLDVLTPGDVMTGTFNSCDDGDGVVVSGTLSMTVEAFSGDLLMPPYSVTVAFSLTNFALTESGETGTINGDGTLSESTPDDVFFTTTMSGASLSFTDTTGDAGTVSDFTVTGTEDFNTLEYTVDSSGTLASVDLGGSVQYVTTTTFEGIADNYPFIGVMVVTGDNSTETITVVDSINLTLEIDENGDGIVDQTIPTTWDAL
jgi:hypothetical protein